jgi:hypothetical protein
VLAAGTLLLLACNRSPSAPEAHATVHRTVTAVVRDAGGAPVEGARLTWTALFDSAGLVDRRVTESDTDGESRQVLAEGGWRIGASLGSRAAGASLVVPGMARALADTQVVRLTLRDASRLTGIVTLAGRTDHSGTIVSAETGAFAVTNAAGAWTISGVPLGRWTVTAHHPSFQTGLALVTVTTPGSVVSVPAMLLVSSP